MKRRERERVHGGVFVRGRTEKQRQTGKHEMEDDTIISLPFHFSVNFVPSFVHDLHCYVKQQTILAFLSAASDSSWADTLRGRPVYSLTKATTFPSLQSTSLVSVKEFVPPLPHSGAPRLYLPAG